RLFVFCFFFSSRRRHTRFSRDWSSDVCSSDLEVVPIRGGLRDIHGQRIDAQLIEGQPLPDAAQRQVGDELLEGEKDAAIGIVVADASGGQPQQKGLPGQIAQLQLAPGLLLEYTRQQSVQQWRDDENEKRCIQQKAGNQRGEQCADFCWHPVILTAAVRLKNYVVAPSVTSALPEMRIRKYEF